MDFHTLCSGIQDLPCVRLPGLTHPHDRTLPVLRLLADALVRPPQKHRHAQYTLPLFRFAGSIAMAVNLPNCRPARFSAAITASLSEKVFDGRFNDGSSRWLGSLSIAIGINLIDQAGRQLHEDRATFFHAAIVYLRIFTSSHNNVIGAPLDVYPWICDIGYVSVNKAAPVGVSAPAEA